jgi:predicted dehydrogenase
MKKLRTAVVGLGRVGWQFHLPQAVRHEGFEVVAVVDPLVERLEEARATFGVKKGYREFEEMLNAEKLDLVVIASPTQFHAEQTIAAFEHGCDVFCDKPVAPTLDEADRMIAASRERGRKLMIYQPHRARSETVALRELLRRDLIGPVYMIKRASSRYVRRHDWQAFRKFGGGMLNNYGAHYIDQLLYVSGGRVERLSCMLRTIASLGDAEDVVKVLIETNNKVILDLDINMATAYPLPAWQALGQRGSLLLDEKQGVWLARYVLPGDLPEAAANESLAAANRRYDSGEVIPWREESFPLTDFKPVDFYRECYEYFALNRPPFVPIEESRELMRILEACREDSEGLPF